MALRAPSIHVIPRALVGALLTAVVVLPAAFVLVRGRMQRLYDRTLAATATIGAECVMDRTQELMLALEAAKPRLARELAGERIHANELGADLEQFLADQPLFLAVAILDESGVRRVATAPMLPHADPIELFAAGTGKLSPIAANNPKTGEPSLWIPLHVTTADDVRIIGLVDAAALLPKTSPTQDGDRMRIALPHSQRSARSDPFLGADLRIGNDDRAGFLALRVELPRASKTRDLITRDIVGGLATIGALFAAMMTLSLRLLFGPKIRRSGDRGMRERRVWNGPRVEAAATAAQGPLLVKIPPPEVDDTAMVTTTSDTTRIDA